MNITLQELLNRLNRIAMEDPNRLDNLVELADKTGAPVGNVDMVMHFEHDRLNDVAARVVLFAR